MAYIELYKFINCRELIVCNLGSRESNFHFIQKHSYKLGQLGWKFFMGAQETIVYRLVMRNLSLMMLIFHFWFLGPLLVGKLAWPQLVWSLKTQPRSWSNGWIFWVNWYFEIMFSKFSGVNPHLNRLIYNYRSGPGN